MEEIIGEVLFYDVLFVPCADDELVETVVAVELHDVPEDWHTAQFYHGLGFELGFFGDARAVAARKN